MYPFTFNYNSTSNADGSSTFVAHSWQQDFEYEEKLIDGFSYYSKGAEEEVSSTDQYALNPAGAIVTRTIDSGADYRSTDTKGFCYSRFLTANNLALATVVDGTDCGGKNSQ